MAERAAVLHRFGHEVTVLASGLTRAAALDLGFAVTGYRRSPDPDVGVVAFEQRADRFMANMAGAEIALDTRDVPDRGRDHGWSVAGVSHAPASRDLVRGSRGCAPHHGGIALAARRMGRHGHRRDLATSGADGRVQRVHRCGPGCAHRVISTLRRECVDRLLILNERHLRSVRAEYPAHDNEYRPHRCLAQRTPVADAEPIPRPGPGNAASERMEVLGGPIHEYRGAA
jgi:hypothetical protein